MSKGKILIVDDEPDELREYSQIVGSDGYEVIEAAGSSDWLKHFEESAPDVVLVDAVLDNGVAGVDVCRQIKSLNGTAGSLVLMISGERVSPDHIAEALEFGADGYLNKPVEPKVLLAHIRALMRIKAAERELSESREQYREIAEQLKVSNRRLEEYNRLKAEFIANMSHELRTPLTAIIGFAQLSKLKPPSTPVPPECDVAFDRILQNGKHLLSLIDEVLDVAKIEAGRLRIHREHVDVADLARSAFEELQALALQKGLDYRLKVLEDIPLALTDPLRLRQVMINLLSNAIKFTNKGGVEAELTRPDKDHFRFAVRDTGIGIEDEAVDLIFERFRQIDGTSTRLAGGTGLGLSIVKQIVLLMGGTIGVSSKSGEGSVFTVTLPLAVREEIHAERPDSGDLNGRSEPEERPHEDDDRPLVLIVEDDPDMAELLSETVSKADYRVRIAHSGADGLRFARDNDVAAIVLDVMMPGMDGWKVLQELKSERRTAAIPVIVCSIVDNRPLGYRLGASNYLIKPIDPEGLLSALKNAGTAGARADGDGGYVLVVDDEHGIRELLSTALKKAGFDARSAASGEMALKMVSEVPPKAIISDLMMPGGMSGYELIARVRADKRTEHVPIIIITGKDMTPDDRRFIIGEIARVIKKGDLLMSDLETRLRQTLEEIGVNPSSGESTTR
ncbi:MAG: response regulator [Pyrinomonadaceae bacterium]